MSCRSSHGKRAILDTTDSEVRLTLSQPSVIIAPHPRRANTLSSKKW
jgi:hypothetical protein